jgi:hypothetical protein
MQYEKKSANKLELIYSLLASRQQLDCLTRFHTDTCWPDANKKGRIFSIRYDIRLLAEELPLRIPQPRSYAFKALGELFTNSTNLFLN